MKEDLKQKPCILIIDDDEMLCDVMSRHLEKMNYAPQYSLTLQGGMEALDGTDIDIVLLDVMLPDGDGLAALPEICRKPCRPEVIIITGEGDEEGAELALKNGAWDYIEKPPSYSKLSLTLKRVLQYRLEKKDRKPALVLNRRELSVTVTECERR